MAVVIGPPTIHAGTLTGALLGLTGGPEGPIGQLSGSGAALVVYGLE